jgi:hypothetical protein
MVIAGITLIIGISVVIADPYELRENLFGGVKPPRTIAVLPLLNLSGDANQDYFADGMTEALTTDLARMEAVQVISRSSAMQYKGVKNKPLSTIAGELHADEIVEGSVQRVGNRVRVGSAADSPALMCLHPCTPAQRLTETRSLVSTPI